MIDVQHLGIRFAKGYLCVSSSAMSIRRMSHFPAGLVEDKKVSG
jgi:hypothetical protein